MESIGFEIEEIPAPEGGIARILVWVIDGVENYEGLPTAEAKTLRFVATLEAVLSNLAHRLDLPAPAPLPRTRRERLWLEAGNADPGPATFALSGPWERSVAQRMPSDTFWRLIDSLTGDTADRNQQLRDRLADLSLSELVTFHARFSREHRELDTPEIWDAATRHLGWVSDDVFADLRSWIIGLGSATYGLARKSAADLSAVLSNMDIEQLGDADDLASAAADIYTVRVGRAILGDYRFD